MCLQKRKIYTNAHRLYRDRMQPYELWIQCGQCTECRKAIANEWRARTYYEYLDTIEKGGFALWDRLSYSNENLPHLAALERMVPKNLDFTCFNRNDIKKFMKRLRANLKYKGINPKKTIRYLIAAEYGQEEGRYMADKGYMREGTLRPHYHIILYCTNKNITPAELSMEIKKAWELGTTNGIEDNPTYFSEKGVIKTKADAITISDYIGKYCLKNQDYDKVARYKIQEIVRHYIAAEKGIYYDDVKDKELKLKVNRDRIQAMTRRVATFHTQSQGYGKTALDNKKAMKKEGLLGMPDKTKTWFYQPMPMYFQRKLWYDYTRTEEGKVIWYMNEKGLEHKMKTMTETINRMATKAENLQSQFQDENFIDLIRKYNDDNKINKDARETWRKINDLAFAYRNGRPWKHYIEYCMFYRGRIESATKTEPWQIILTNYQSSLSAEKESKALLFYNYCHTTDKDHFGKRMIGHEDLGDKWKGYKKPNGDELRPDQFSTLYVVNENTLTEWENYDKLTDILDQVRYYIEWNDSERTRRQEAVRLTWQGMKKTLYNNIINYGN